MDKYIQASLESGKNFYQQYHDKGKVVMLNMLKFKQKADYTNLEQIKPEEEISGEEAYKLYLHYTLPLLRNAGGSIVYYGKSTDFLIGPESEKWDAILIIEYPSVMNFMKFAQSEEYAKNAGHRSAALEDSRLLPSTQIKDKI